jgi:hypothetical protein
MLQAATYGYDKEEFSHLLTRGLFPDKYWPPARMAR